jgi:hypothetical protein
MMEVVKFWGGIVLTVVLLLATVYLFWLMFFGPSKKKMQAQSNLNELLTTSIGINAFVISNLTSSGFGGSIHSFGQWLRFFAQEALGAIMLDIPDVFNVRFSDIEPHTGFARLGTVFFKFLITAGLVNLLWLVYRRRFYQEVLSGTVKECFWKCQNLLDRDTLELKREGKVDLFKHPERSVAVVDLIEALGEQD